MNAASSPNKSLDKAISLFHQVAPGPALVGPEEPAVAGLVPFSSVDWPGHLSAVVFIGGCPWRCGYCHNPHLQSRRAQYHWPALCSWLETRRGLLDAVVFSGGEPLSERMLPQMIAAVRAMGFKVALHTAGIYPSRLAEILPDLNWVGLDIKTHAKGHDALTGRERSHAPTAASLELMLESGVPFECRTTWSPAWLSEAELLALAQDLAARGVVQYAVQNYRVKPDIAPTAWLSTAARQQLQSWFRCFEYR